LVLATGASTAGIASAYPCCRWGCPERTAQRQQHSTMTWRLHHAGLLRNDRRAGRRAQPDLDEVRLLALEVDQASARRFRRSMSRAHPAPASNETRRRRGRHAPTGRGKLLAAGMAAWPVSKTSEGTARFQRRCRSNDLFGVAHPVSEHAPAGPRSDTLRGTEYCRLRSGCLGSQAPHSALFRGRPDLKEALVMLTLPPL